MSPGYVQNSICVLFRATTKTGGRRGVMECELDVSGDGGILWYSGSPVFTCVYSIPGYIQSHQPQNYAWWLVV